jgi:acyl-CoA synthetase (AMP-forming)/AMP-acid ligase II/thioesterase domain-containing protein
MTGTGPARTIWQLIQDSMRRHGEAPALLAPGRDALSYAGLGEQTARLAGRLGAAGIGREDRVAVVLPNGPEMAAAFVAVASCAAFAPLNPNYTRRDFEFYLSDIAASALLVEEATPAAAREAADALGIPVHRVRKLARAGEFDLDVAGACAAPSIVDAEQHIALLLHTSGTTSRPKLVPLSSENLTASAAHVAATLALGPADRCLNIMPLFHIHGLVAALLASLDAGASVVCTNGIYGDGFFDWMREFRPTWYTAVPTMHQAILARAAEHAEAIRETRLRFIRSSSAPLAPVVLEALETTFGAPVVEAYGMTEAAHQMTSNPLPPAARKPGSVGPAAGPEVAIMDASGSLLEHGQAGEVVIRGRNVTSGYLANPEANQAAFTNGWFRTGDQGRLDADGYLHLTGRLKEIINRGGEKISPREIDEVLLDHPAVRQAVAFAVPHAQLGEEVGAAVEVHAGQSAGAGELKQWAAERLAGFKVPRVIRIVESIPKGPTGKLQRIGLAAKLGIEPIDDRVIGEFVAPRTPREELIAAIWRKMLPGARTGVTDRFEALGGDSLLAVGMLAEVSAAERVEVPYQRFVEEGTIAAIAAEIESSAHPAAGGAIVPLNTRGRRTPLFCIPGHLGTLLGLARMAESMGPEQPVFALDPNRMEAAESMAELAEQCLTHVRRVQPQGPYRLAGVCFGGVVAFEMARLLSERGEAVELLALIDSLNPAWQRDAGVPARVAASLRQMRHRFAQNYRTVRGMRWSRVPRWTAGRAAAFFRYHGGEIAARIGAANDGRVFDRALLDRYRPAGCELNAVVVAVRGLRADVPNLGWLRAVLGRIEMAEIPFDPHGALAEGNVRRVAAILAERLDGRDQ